jgi:hypothetical protein
MINPNHMGMEPQTMLINISPSISHNHSLILDHRSTLILHMLINKGKFTVAMSVGRRILSLHRHRIHRLPKHRILSSNLNNNLTLNSNLIFKNNHRHSNLLSIRPEYMPNNHNCSRSRSNNFRTLARPTFLIQMQHIQIQTLKHGRNTMPKVGRIPLGRCTLFPCQA